MLFSNMARDDAKRDKFVTTTVDFLLKHKFDGLGECFTFFSIFYLVCFTSTAPLQFCQGEQSISLFKSEFEVIIIILTKNVRVANLIGIIFLLRLGLGISC